MDYSPIIGLMLIFLTLVVLEIGLKTLFAYFDWIAAKKAYHLGEVPEWIETNGSYAGWFVHDRTWIYKLIARLVKTKYEMGERIGPYSASGMVVLQFKYLLFRFLPD
jgi:hypothetical protein